MPSVELSTAAVMATVTWLEGIARIPADAVVLRRVAFGPWRAHEPVEIGSGWRLVAWWPPLTLSVTLPTETPASRCSDARLMHRLRARERRARVPVTLLRVVGALVIVALVAGIPLATARFGVRGLAASLGAVLYLAACASAAAYAGLRRAGVARRKALGAAAGCLWPFAALRGAALVQSAVVAGAPPSVVARALLGEPAFAAWVRPALWDVAHGVDAGGAMAGIAASLPRDQAMLLAGAMPDERDAGDTWCPRCARLYRAGVETCAACEGVELVG